MFITWNASRIYLLEYQNLLVSSYKKPEKKLLVCTFFTDLKIKNFGKVWLQVKRYSIGSAI